MYLLLSNPSHWQKKDQEKIFLSNKFIGKGSKKSSTELYRKLYKDKANVGFYTPKDLIFISVEGNRSGRYPLNKKEVLLALTSGATIICDTQENRSRSYNIGEKELYHFLVENDYEEVLSTKYFALYKPKEDKYFDKEL